MPQDPSSLVTWQQHLSSLADRAMNALMNALMDEVPNPPKRITPAYLLKARIVKDWVFSAFLVTFLPGSKYE